MSLLPSAMSPDPRPPSTQRRAPPHRAVLLVSAARGGQSAPPTDLISRLAAALPAGWDVFGVLYDNQTALTEALRAITQRGVRDLVVIPMHPQFSESTSGALVRDLYGILAREGHDLNVAVRATWYDDAGYIKALIRKLMEHAAVCHARAEDTRLHFVADDPPDLTGRETYHTHVRTTAQLVAGRLGWPADRWSVEIGRTPEASGGDHTDVLVCGLPFPNGPGEVTNEHLHECPALWTFDPFITALRNLVLHGPQPTCAAERAPSSPPTRSTQCSAALAEPASLVMIGASVGNGLGPGRGPAIRYSDPSAFAHVKKSRKALRGFLHWIRDDTEVAEAFVWNTCQRIEFYGWIPEHVQHDARECLVRGIRERLYESEPDGLEINVLAGSDAWHHLVRTACGLNSDLPGDHDVADQLLTACRIGHCAQTVGPRSATVVHRAVAIAQEARARTAWGTFATGYCAAAVARICEVDELRPDELRHVVIGGSTTSRSVLATLSGVHDVPPQQLTLVYRDHHGQLKQLRTALRNGRRLRVHSYSEEPVLQAIADADVVYFGIDHPEPVLDASLLHDLRDYAGRRLTLVDFNSFGSVASLEPRDGVTVWAVKELDRAVAAHAALTTTRAGFAAAVDQAEDWIVEHLADVMPFSAHGAGVHHPAGV
jgi:glutamyl-tRNA reductase